MNQASPRNQPFANPRVSLLHPLRRSVLEPVVSEKKCVGVGNIIATRLGVGVELFAPGIFFDFTANTGASGFEFFNCDAADPAAFLHFN